MSKTVLLWTRPRRFWPGHQQTETEQCRMSVPHPNKNTQYMKHHIFMVTSKHIFALDRTRSPFSSWHWASLGLQKTLCSTYACSFLLRFQPHPELKKTLWESALGGKDGCCGRIGDRDPNGLRYNLSRTLQHKSTDSPYCQSQSTQHVGPHLQSCRSSDPSVQWCLMSTGQQWKNEQVWGKKSRGGRTKNSPVVYI